MKSTSTSSVLKLFLAIALAGLLALPVQTNATGCYNGPANAYGTAGLCCYTPPGCGGTASIAVASTQYFQFYPYNAGSTYTFYTNGSPWTAYMTVWYYNGSAWYPWTNGTNSVTFDAYISYTNTELVTCYNGTACPGTPNTPTWPGTSTTLNYRTESPSTPGISSSASVICNGSNVNYVASDGGNGYIDGLEYQWNTTGGAWTNVGTTNWNWASNSPGNTLYVRARQFNAGCYAYSGAVSTYVDGYPAAGTVVLSSSVVYSGQVVNIQSSGGTGYNRTEYQWNGTGGTWNLFANSTNFNWTSSSPRNTLYVRHVYRSSGGGNCETASGVVTIQVLDANVGWTGQSAVSYPLLPTNCGGYSANWCAGSGTYTYVSLTQGVNYTVENVGGTACSATALGTAYIQAWYTGGGTACGWGAIDWPAVNSYSFNAALTGNHIITVSGNLYSVSLNNSCGGGQGNISGQSAVLRYKQNTTITNTTSTAAVCEGTTIPLTYTLGGAHNNPVPTWAITSTTGTANGSFSGTNFTATGAGTVTIRATVGACYSDVTFAVLSGANDPGVISLPAATICPGTAVTTNNDASATTGSPASAGPTYYFYYSVTNNTNYTLFLGPTNSATASLPAAVINTPGTYYIARNSKFACTNQVNNANTLDKQITVLASSASTPVASAGSTTSPNSTCSSFYAFWNASTGVIPASGYQLDVTTDPSFGTITVLNNGSVGNVTSYNVTGLTAGMTYYYRVRAVGCAGATANSNVASGMTLPQTPDVAVVPTSITSGSCNSFAPTWTAAARATSYLVDISSSASFSPLIASGVSVASSGAYTQTGLIAGVRYYYRVRSANVCGTSGNSSTTYVDMPAGTPPAPVATVGTAGCNQFTANWAVAGQMPSPSDPTNNLASNYFIDIASSLSLLTSAPDIRNNLSVGNVTNFTQTGLGANTTYYYRVRGSSTCGGTGASSNNVTVVTLPPAPATPTANSGTGAACTSFTANWSSSSGTSTYYVDLSTSSTFATTIRTDAVDASSYPNGAGGTFTFPAGSSADVIAMKACESVYGAGNCSQGSCVNFYYYYQTGGQSCVCTKPIGSYEFIYANSGATTVGQDYGGQNTSIVGAVPFTRKKTSATCDANSWTLTQANLGSAASSITSFLETGLSAGVTYYYRVRAANNCGTSSNSNISPAVTLNPPTPDVPSASAPGTPTCTSITANWAAAARATAYFLDISTNSTFATIDIQNNLNLGTALTYTQGGLTAGVNYYYRVRGGNNCGTSASSVVITAPTRPATPAVPAVSAPSSITCTSFTANWGSSANALEYRLDIAADPGFSTLILNNQSVTTGTSYNQSTGVSAGNTYYYRVRAGNDCGTSGSSTTGTVVMPPATPPVNSTNPASAINCTSFTANWTSSSNATIYYYDVANDAAFTSIVASGSTSNLFANITGLTAGNTYRYRVRAGNPCGTAANSDTRSVTLLPPQPGAPTATGPTLIDCDNFVANWTENAPLTATSHRLDVSTSPTFATFVTGYNNRIIGNVTSFNVTGLTVGQTYYYRVRSVNSCGTSASSNVQSVDLNKVPVITSCPGSIVVNNDASLCDATVMYNPAIAVGPPTPSISYSQNSGTVFPLGTTTVYVTATNSCGTAVCSFNVTVNDAEPPTIICPDGQFVDLDEACYASLPDYTGSAGVFDNCTFTNLPPELQSPIAITQDPAPGMSLGVGSITVTLTATDASGNHGSCPFDVFILDNIFPQPIVQDVTVQLDASGNASIDASMVDAGSYDNCGILYTLVYPNTFTCAEVGTNEVTFEVGDINGNVSTTSAFVEVQDVTNPTPACQDVTVQLDESGNYNDDGFGLGALVDAGSYDNCAISSYFAYPSVFTCAEVGANPVTLEVTDANGLTSTCDATAFVEDNVSPEITCPGDATIECAESSAPSNTGEAMATDACGVSVSYLDASTQSMDASAFEHYNYTITRTWTATDANNNQTSCDQTITVVSQTPPSAQAQDFTTSLDASGGVRVFPTDIDNGSYAICGGPVTLMISHSPPAAYLDFTCADVGDNNVLLWVYDVSGNVSTAPAVVTIVDDIAPDAVCKDITVQLDNSGAASITPADVDGGSSDACAFNLSIDIDAFGCANVGPNTVTLTAADVNGNSSTCTSTVTVRDDIAPVARCKDITIQLNVSGGATITPASVDNGSSDACAFSLSIDKSSFGCATVGGNTVTLTATDVNGNSSTCTSTVTVEDNVAPDAVCKDITIQLDHSGAASITPASINNGSFDACAFSLSIDVDAFDCSNVGANTVILTAADVNGNSSTCTSTVTVEDNVAPDAVCKDITIQLDHSGAASITPASINNGSFDACAFGLSIDVDAFDCSNVGANTVILTAADVNGNSSTCYSTVTVEDNIAPDIACHDITVVLNNVGTFELFPADVDAGSSDACAFNLTIDQGNYDCGDVGANANVLTAMDASGNSSTCAFVVTVQDNYIPDITCPADVTVNCQDDHSSAATGTATGYDNCAFGISQSDASTQDPDATHAGHYNYTITRTWTATDVHGNSRSCNQLITVHDVTIPTFTAPADITIHTDANCNYDISVANVGDVTNESDNCTSGKQATYSDAIIPGPTGSYVVFRTWSLSDYAGNAAADQVQTITITDVTAPHAICRDIILQLDYTGNASITPADVNNGSYDNCQIASLAVYPNTFTCSQVGANPVATLTVTDVNGNVSACISTINVQDNVAPEVICKNIGIQLNALGEATITAPQVTQASGDACGIASSSVTPFKFGCDNVGSNTVTLTVYDVNGNSTSCNASVLVQDKTPAVAICQNVTVYLNGSGQAFVTAAMINNGSNDACGISSLSANITSFTCSNVGPNTVTLTVTDNNGNQSQCNSTVTVTDAIFPTALCKNTTVTLNNVGFASITTANINNGSYDNCGIASMSVAPNTFGCANIGANAVTLTVTDVNGHVSTCNASTQVVGAIPSCTITSVPANSTYTGGVPTNIYLGYGPQSVTLQTNIIGGTGQTYSWTCTNPNWVGRLSCTNCAAPVFTPTLQGNYTFTVNIVNNYGCITSCSITICVLNVNVSGSQGKVYIAHYPSGTLPCPSTAMCNTLSVATSAIPAHLAHTCDHLGFCNGTGTQICAPNAKDDEAQMEITRTIDDKDVFEVKAFPNPFNNQFHLSITSSNDENIEIKIFDVLGQMIENKKAVPFEEDVMFGSKLSKGVYLVEVTQGKKTQVVRIVKSE